MPGESHDHALLVGDPGRTSMEPRTDARGEVAVLRADHAVRAGTSMEPRTDARGERDAHVPRPGHDQTSMEPRTDARGEPDAQELGAEQLDVTSMEPRTDARGEARRRSRARARGPTSMEPRTDARGESSRQQPNLFKYLRSHFRAVRREPTGSSPAVSSVIANSSISRRILAARDPRVSRGTRPLACRSRRRPHPEVGAVARRVSVVKDRARPTSDDDRAPLGRLVGQAERRDAGGCPARRRAEIDE